MRRLWILGLLLLALPAFGQFRVFPNTIQMEEGGRINQLVIVSEASRFSVRQPSGFTFRVDVLNKSVLFKSADEKSAITLQITTNFPGQLPDQETLRARALEQTPGASIIMTSVCSTGYKPGVFFDLVRILREGLSVRFRHVYAPSPDGTIEFVFATDNAAFEKERFVFGNFVNSFRVETGGNRAAGGN